MQRSDAGSSCPGVPIQTGPRATGDAALSSLPAKGLNCFFTICPSPAREAQLQRPAKGSLCLGPTTAPAPPAKQTAGEALARMSWRRKEYGSFNPPTPPSLAVSFSSLAYCWGRWRWLKSCGSAVLVLWACTLPWHPVSWGCTPVLAWTSLGASY